MTDTNGSLPVESDAVKAAIAHHVNGYDRVVSERDDLQRQCDKKEQMHTVMRIECEGLRAELAAERSRTGSYQRERDEAVVRYAALERTVDDIYAIILRSKATTPEVEVSWSDAHPEIAEKLRDLK